MDYEDLKILMHSYKDYFYSESEEEYYEHE